MLTGKHILRSDTWSNFNRWLRSI